MPTGAGDIAAGFEKFGIAIYGLALCLIAVVGLFTLLLRSKDRQIERLEMENARIESLREAAVRAQLTMATSLFPLAAGLTRVFEYHEAKSASRSRKGSVGGDTGSFPALPPGAKP